jgi:hypothetical protein
VEMRSNVCGMSSNHEGVFIGWGMKFDFFRNLFQIFWSHNGKKRLVFEFKQLFLNLNRKCGPIRPHHVAIVRRL